MASISIYFAWHYFCIGFFYDRASRVVYLCPIPMLVIQFNLKNPDHMEPVPYKVEPCDYVSNYDNSYCRDGKIFNYRGVQIQGMDCPKCNKK